VNAPGDGKINESHPPNMNIIFPPTIAFRLIRAGRTALLVVGASVFVFSLTLSRPQKIIGQKANSSAGLDYQTLPDGSIPKTSIAPNSGSLASDNFHPLSELDRKFLDDLFRQQDSREQDNSASRPVPKTELTLPAKTAKRAELVVHNETVKRAELVQRGRD
jgi:hypothetical protein